MNGLLGYNSDSGDGEELLRAALAKGDRQERQVLKTVSSSLKEVVCNGMDSSGGEDRSRSRSMSISPVRDVKDGSPIQGSKITDKDRLSKRNSSESKAAESRNSRDSKYERRTARDGSVERPRKRSRSSSKEKRRRRSRSSSKEKKRRRSRSTSRERKRKSRSNSRDRRYRKGSRSSRSKSPERKRRSRSNSRGRRRHSRSRTPTLNKGRSRRSRSKERRRHRSRSRSRSRSPKYDRRSRSRSPRRFSPKRRVPLVVDRRKTICRAVLPPSFGKDKDRVPTTEEVEAKLKAHMEKMKEKASEDAKNVNLPSYLNPAMVNVQQFKQQQEKRKLLWSSKKSTEQELPASQETTEQGGSWTGSAFQDNETEAKFRRLMGIKGTQTLGAGNQVEKSRKVLEDLEREYERSRAFQLSRGAGGTTGIGLGFNQAP